MQRWEELAYARQDGKAEGRAKGIEALILDNLEEGKSRETIIEKLIRHFSITDQEANSYFEKYKK